MHQRRLTQKCLKADLGTGTQVGKQQIVDWLAEGNPQHSGTERFQARDCNLPTDVQLKGDTLTFHRGDLRGVVWEQKSPRACLWLMVLAQHDEGYRLGCVRLANKELYPIAPVDQPLWDHDVDMHAFVSAFLSAARTLLKAGTGKREVDDVGGYFAELELVDPEPAPGWLITFRVTKHKACAPALTLKLGTLVEILRAVFRDPELDVRPEWRSNRLIYPVIAGNPVEEQEWLEARAREFLA